jgi:ABC-type phosphate transport system permease subunit
MMNIVVVASIYIEKKNERAREKKKKKKKKKKTSHLTLHFLFFIAFSLFLLSIFLLHPFYTTESAPVRARRALALALQTIVDSSGGRSDDCMLCCRALMMIVVGEQAYAHSFTYG